MEKNQLKTVIEIFSETWRLYKSKAISIVLVAFLSLLISILLLAGEGTAAFFALGGQPFFTGELRELLINPAVIGTGFFLFLSAILLIAWIHAAILTSATHQEISIPQGLIKSWKYAFPLLWISSLYIGIVIAGTVFLIIPGLLLALSMSFCLFSMVDENRAGIDALLASRLYVRGHWWNTFFKLLLIWTPAVLLCLIPSLAARLFLILLFVPFLILYTATVYHNLKECADAPESSFGFGWLWVFFGAFGFFLPLLAFIGSIVALGPQLPELINQAQTEINKALGTEIFPPPQNDTKESIDKKAAKAPTVRKLPSVDGFIIWRDPIGDARNHLLDIKEVSAKGAQGELVLAITMIRPLADYFLKTEAGDFDPLLSFYLDIDMNQATGSAPFRRYQERNGYDLDVQVQLVAQKDESGKSISGRAEANIYQLNGQERKSLGTLARKAVTVSGDTVTVRLPYDQLKATPGNTIRICYREAAQEQARGLAKDKLVPLQ